MGAERRRDHCAAGLVRRQLFCGDRAGGAVRHARLPLGEGLNAPPSNEDIARVIVACLADSAPHVGKAYRPTGPRLLAPPEIAAAMGEALGRRVQYHNVPIPMFLKAANSLGISEFVISQLYWFLQDYQSNAFGIGAPTNAVEHISGVAPEDFHSIARRYVRSSPDAVRGIAGAMRETAGLLAALVARRPDIGGVEARLGAPVDGELSSCEGIVRLACGARLKRSVLTQQFVDTTLELALFLLALAQPRVEIALVAIRDHGAEGEPEPVGLAPDDPGEEGAALAGDGQLDLVGQSCRGAEFDAGAVFAEIAHHAVHRATAIADPGNAAVKHLVPHALTPILHGSLRPVLSGNLRGLARLGR
jgi:hypothetical protein